MRPTGITPNVNGPDVEESQRLGRPSVEMVTPALRGGSGVPWRLQSP